ncbi:hypothetical protein SLEP1_g31552 [Rubroshorea leprosula]|uniref:Uncharacterized protein n=1 Tax=Rubroshorea leprosula TaxID=152421 RepID=A0AAV5K5T7_9ROSI|nr:hypothetical protein SLEP1_g31552 [Rubroshorea leprosula]
MVPVSPLQLAAGFFSPSRSGSAGWKILVPDRSLSLAPRLSLWFYASEETKPRTRKPREVTS